MKIVDVRTIPLRGATQDTGWPGGTDPNEQMNTLLEIRTDEGGHPAIVAGSRPTGRRRPLYV